MKKINDFYTRKRQTSRNLIGLINETYLFLNDSPKPQQMFELTLKKFSVWQLPQQASRAMQDWLGGKTHMLRCFLEMYEAIITFLDAIMSPHEYKELAGLLHWKLELGQG